MAGTLDNQMQSGVSPATAGIFIGNAELLNEGRVTSNNPEVREFYQDWQVITNTKVDQIWITQAPGLPQMWTPYISPINPAAFDTNAILVERKVDLKSPDSFYIWIVTCRYTTHAPDTGTTNVDEPWKTPVLVEYDAEPFTGPREKDLDGRPFIASNMMPHIPTPVFEDSRVVCVITQFMQFHSAADSRKWSYVTNEEAFLGESQYCWLMLPPRATPHYVGKTKYWKVVRKLRLGRELEDGTIEKWHPVRLLNQGVMRKQNDSTKPDYERPVHIIDANNMPITQPIPLSQDGQPLDAVELAFKSLLGGTGTETILTVEPTYREYRIRKAKKFGDLFVNQTVPFN